MLYTQVIVDGHALNEPRHIEVNRTGRYNVYSIPMADVVRNIRDEVDKLKVRGWGFVSLVFTTIMDTLEAPEVGGF